MEAEEKLNDIIHDYIAFHRYENDGYSYTQLLKDLKAEIILPLTKAAFIKGFRDSEEQKYCAADIVRNYEKWLSEKFDLDQQ